MERRTFLTSLTGATALTVVPWSLSAKPRAHTNYAVGHAVVRAIRKA